MLNLSRLLLLLCAFYAALACTARVEYPHLEGPTEAAGATVNINTASIEELEKLPYVGRKTAESIVIFREQNGPFRRPEHLMLIRGVSEKRFNEIKRMIRVE